jgi:hypothetical protein
MLKLQGDFLEAVAGLPVLTKADLFPFCPRLCIDNDEPEALEQSAEFKVQVYGLQPG